MSKRTFKVAVEGNIGCGKSTFLRYFESISSNVEVFPEPIDQWRNVKGHNLFELFYNDPAKWNSPFRSQIMVTLLNQQSKPQTVPVRLIERSIHSNRFCFIEALRQSNMIPDGDFKVLDEYYKLSRQMPFLNLDLIVYLRSTPEVCANRIRTRSRRGEEGIPMAYLQQLHDLHEDWLLGEKFGQLPAPVLVFDCTAPLEKLTSVYYQQKEQVMCGIKA